MQIETMYDIVSIVFNIVSNYFYNIVCIVL